MATTIRQRIKALSISLEHETEQDKKQALQARIDALLISLTHYEQLQYA